MFFRVRPNKCGAPVKHPVWYVLKKHTIDNNIALPAPMRGGCVLTFKFFVSNKRNSKTFYFTFVLYPFTSSPPPPYRYCVKCLLCTRRTITKSSTGSPFRAGQLYPFCVYSRRLPKIPNNFVYMSRHVNNFDRTGRKTCISKTTVDRMKKN